MRIPALVAVFALALPTEARADSLYAVQWPANASAPRGLYRISPLDGSITLVGETGIPRPVVGLLYRPSDGFLYALTIGSPVFGAPGVYRIDPLTAVSTLVGFLPHGQGDALFEGDFALAPDGTAYGLNHVNASSINTASLWKIDLDDPAASTLVGPITTTGAFDVSSLAWRGDGLLVGHDPTADRLLAIDPLTGAVTDIGPLGFDASALGGIAVLGGRGYLADGLFSGGTNSLHTIDLFTGQTSLVGAFGGLAAPGFSSLAAVPEPALGLLLAVAAALLAARRRRAPEAP